LPKDRFYQDLMPDVRGKINGKKVVQKFDVFRIVNSLEKETTLDPEQLEVVITEFYRAAFQMDPPFMTAPMIREMLCFIMMRGNLPMHRFEYTRLGLPFNDVAQIIDDPDFNEIIAEHVRYEYESVKGEIEELKNEVRSL